MVYATSLTSQPLVVGEKKLNKMGRMKPKQIEIQLNGEAYSLAEPATVDDLIEIRRLNPKQIAVEINGSLVPRENFRFFLISSGDCVEVVSLAGGG